MDINERKFYRWTINHVCSPCDYEKYSKLLQHLYSVDFRSPMSLDDNRMLDGSALWEMYADDHDVAYNECSFFSKPVSVLEVMIGLSVRIENTIMCDVDYGDRTQLWFWCMIKSMGLYGYDDEHYDCEYVDSVICRMLDKRFARDGAGSLFYVKGTQFDMTDMEIWAQMHVFLNGLM